MDIHTVSDNLLNRYEIAYILIEKYIAFLIKQTPFSVNRITLNSEPHIEKYNSMEKNRDKDVFA